MQKISWQQILDLFGLDEDTPYVFGRFETRGKAQEACDTFRQKLKSAYRKQALKTHPDQGGNREDFSTFK
jgi:hypothetical protein